MEQLKGVVMHTKDLGRQHRRLTSNADVRDVVVVGACKSSIEASTIVVGAGKRVHWVVRDSPKDPEIVLETQSYFDRLLTDLDPGVQRKGQGVWGNFKEWLVPYTASDYQTRKRRSSDASDGTKAKDD